MKVRCWKCNDLTYQDKSEYILCKECGGISKFRKNKPESLCRHCGHNEGALLSPAQLPRHIPESWKK